MTSAYRVSSLPQPDFSEADRKFSALKQQLTSGAFRAMRHSDVERHLLKEGTELMRVLLQAYVTLAGRRKVKGEVVGADGTRRTHVHSSARREVESIFGSVVVERASHSSPGRAALKPVDAWLNLPSERYSLEVRRRVSLAAAQSSFDATLATLDLTTGAHVPKRQAEQLVVRAANHFDAFYEARCAVPLSGQPGPYLVLSFDQKGVVVHPQDLRAEAVRKSPTGTKSVLESRYAPGMKHGRKRMATVAAVYTTEPQATRCSSDVIDGLRHRRGDEEPVRRPRPQRKRVWASVTHRPRDVIDAAFAEARNRDPYHEKQWFVLIDGSPDLERWVREVAERRGHPVTIIIDFIHVLEWLWRAAHAFHPPGSTQAEEWALERMTRILDGKVVDVAAGISRSATRRGLSGMKRKVVDQCTHYLHAHKHKMSYPMCLGLGVPIATGVIEGACRHLVCDRLEITGARWRLERAEAILRLRALIASGDFDEYWQFHEAEEWRQNHASKYTGDLVPLAAETQAPRHLRLVQPPS